MPALSRTNQQLEVALQVTQTSSGNPAVEEGARKQGLRESLAKRPEGKQLADGEALQHHGWGRQEERARHGTASPAARSCCILPACLGPSPAPAGITTTTQCLQPARASRNNLCMVSAQEDITVPLKEHCLGSSLAREVSKNRPFSVEIATALGSALTAP